MLTPDEMNHFNREGYLLKEGVFSQQDCANVLGAIAEIIQAAIDSLREEGWRGNDYAGESVHSRLPRIYANDPKAGARILGAVKGAGGGGYHGPAMLAALRHENLLSIMQSLVGETIVGCSAYRIRPKLPHLPGGEVPWHQDSGYFMEHCDRNLIVTAWVALVNATPENGCMYVLPR